LKSHNENTVFQHYNKKKLFEKSLFKSFLMLTGGITMILPVFAKREKMPDLGNSHLFLGVKIKTG